MTLPPAINPLVGYALLERFPFVTRGGLVSMWAAACYWVGEQAKGAVSREVAEQAANLYVLSICMDDAAVRQGLRYSAVELLQMSRRY